MNYNLYRKINCNLFVLFVYYCYFCQSKEENSVLQMKQNISILHIIILRLKFVGGGDKVYC